MKREAGGLNRRYILNVLLAFPQSIRVASVWRKEDAFAEADWKSLSQLVSLSDLDVNDFRYTLYRAQVHLNAQQAVDEHFLLFNMYTRDIVSVQVNGKPAKRLFPDKADAQSWTTRDCFSRIRHDEYDNRFDVSGLLCEGDNEIIRCVRKFGSCSWLFSYGRTYWYPTGRLIAYRVGSYTSVAMGVCYRYGRYYRRMVFARIRS